MRKNSSLSITDMQFCFPSQDADAPGKQELETSLVALAEVLAVDLVTQCLDHREVSHAAASGDITPNQVSELGAILIDPDLGRANDQEVTIADLTGIND